MSGRMMSDTRASGIREVCARGVLIDDCSLPGEGKTCGAAPAHPNGIQLSADRFLLLYTTRGFRGRDDEWSGVYQVREGHWTGRVIKEGYVCKTTNEWDPLGDGGKYVKQHGHPVAFGVPKGARIEGNRAPHENVFAVMWREVARVLDPETAHLLWTTESAELDLATSRAMIAHFRLNDAADDIEFLTEPRVLRQRGFENGDRLCDNPAVRRMIKGFVCPVSLNADCSEWVDINTVQAHHSTLHVAPDARSEASPDGMGGVLPVKYRFNSRAGLYEWVETGPLIGPKLFEGSIAGYGGGFVIAARMRGLDGIKAFKEGKRTKVVAWAWTKDPFGPKPKIVFSPDHPTWHPVTVFQAADGSILRIGGCPEISPYQAGRNPIYLLKVDPENGFAPGDRHAVYDAKKDPSLAFSGPGYVDFGKLLPHTGGREQVLVHRVRSSDVLWGPEKPDVRPTEGDIRTSAIHWASVIFREDQPPMWRF